MMSIWILVMPVSLSAQSMPAWNQPAGVIVIDPGHGGNDEGAKGTAGALEKTICLDLAKKLAGILDNSYKVVLTRNGDYNLQNDQRSAAANHHKADAFISLHAAAAFQHTIEGISIYSYKPLEQPETTEAAQNQPSPASPVWWQDTQLRHTAASSALAAALQNHLESFSGSNPVRIQQAPLHVLAGADMAAAVIEIGYLTHPQTEKNLTSDTQLTVMARSIANAIDAFMASRH